MDAIALRRSSWIGLVLAAALAACSGDDGGDGTGACVFTYRLDAEVSACEDGYDSGECSAAQDENYGSTFHDGQTCAGLGYTLTCPGDPPGLLRRVCPAG